MSSFNLAKDCFICGTSCNLTRHLKHLDCWEKNSLQNCWSGKDKQGIPIKGFKDILLEVCGKRDDILGDTVMVCLQRAPSIFMLQMEGKSFLFSLLSFNFAHSQIEKSETRNYWNWSEIWKDCSLHFWWEGINKCSFNQPLVCFIYSYTN